jgi:hypothetical protein
MQTLSTHTTIGDYDEFRDVPWDLEPMEKIRDDWKISDDSADPRGRFVEGPAGKRLGIIEDILVSRSRKKALFAIVKTEEGLGRKCYLVPLSALEIADGREDQKVYRGLTEEDFRSAPALNREKPDYSASHDYWNRARVR